MKEAVFDPQQDGWQIMTFRAATDADVHADHWEVHTTADEVVACLAGEIRMHFHPDADGAAEDVRLSAGSAVVVPRGAWHRIALVSPAEVMSVTVPSGSRLAPVRP